MKIVAFKNGNFNVKKEDGDFDLLESLIYSAELDFQVAGDEGCATNYDMYYPLYNAYTDKLYLVLGSEMASFEEGKTIKLIGHVLSEDERKEIEDNY
jgi:hypothetical protein